MRVEALRKMKYVLPTGEAVTLLPGVPVSLPESAIRDLMRQARAYLTVLLDTWTEASHDPEAPIHQYLAPHYIDFAKERTGVPNIVTAVLASYRGYDTLGETTVIFAAGVGVLLGLGTIRRRGRKPITDDDVSDGVAPGEESSP